MVVADLMFEGFKRRHSERELAAIEDARQVVIDHIDRLAQLSERNRTILTLRFGIEDNVIRSMDTIARILDLNAEIVPGIVEVSLLDLRHGTTE